jgi:hypothetical protein
VRRPRVLAGCSDAIASEWEAQEDLYEADSAYDLTLYDDGTGDLERSYPTSCYDETTNTSTDTTVRFKGEIEWEEGENSGEYALTLKCKGVTGACPADGCFAKGEAECDLSEDGEAMTCLIDYADRDYPSGRVWTKKGD